MRFDFFRAGAILFLLATTAACQSPKFNFDSSAPTETPKVAIVVTHPVEPVAPTVPVPPSSAPTPGANVTRASASPTRVVAQTQVTLTPTRASIATMTPTARGSATLAPSATNTPRCPAIALQTKASSWVKSVTLASGVNADTNAPVNPTTSFARAATIHAVVATQNAPTDTLFKIKWYAHDVGAVAACNTFVDEAELRDEGDKQIDFTLAPPASPQQRPLGAYRAEVYVNGVAHQQLTFTVR